LQDHPDDDDNSDDDDENPIEPLVNDEDAETFIQDLQNLFNSNMMDSTRASFMTNIGLDESKLINAPNVICLLLKIIFGQPLKICRNWTEIGQIRTKGRGILAAILDFIFQS
jgi:hypothetical protein